MQKDVIPLPALEISRQVQLVVKNDILTTPLEENCTQFAVAEAVAIPPPPDDVQGVKVRKGIKHQPTQPAKRSGVQPVEVVDDRPDIPVNTVPDGAPPPEPKAPPVPETEATAIPSGDAPP